MLRYFKKGQNSKQFLCAVETQSPDPILLVTAFRKCTLHQKNYEKKIMILKSWEGERNEKKIFLTIVLYRKCSKIREKVQFRDVAALFA